MNDAPGETQTSVIRSTAYDPTAYQIETLVGEELDLSEELLTQPGAAKWLLHMHKVGLYQLQKAQTELMTERERSEISRDKAEALRIELAKQDTSRTVSLLDIPVSILSGLSINMLFVDGVRGLGLCIMFVCILILTAIRGSDFKRFLLAMRKNQENGNE